MLGRTFRLDTSPASANGPACDFERHPCRCRSSAEASPRPSYERPARGPQGRLTTTLRRGAPLNERPAGARRGTRPRQVSVGDRRLGCGCRVRFHQLRTRGRGALGSNRPSLCENSTRYKRTLNFEACGRAQSKKRKNSSSARHYDQIRFRFRTGAPGDRQGVGGASPLR
jgi:hypothetical protein